MYKFHRRLILVTVVRVKNLGSNRQAMYFKMNLQIDLERSAGPRSHPLQRTRTSRRESRNNILLREPEFDVIPCRALKPSDGQLNVKHGKREMSGASRRILDVFRIPQERFQSLPSDGNAALSQPCKRTVCYLVLARERFQVSFCFYRKLLAGSKYGACREQHPKLLLSGITDSRICSPVSEWIRRAGTQKWSRKLRLRKMELWLSLPSSRSRSHLGKIWTWREELIRNSSR